MEALLGYELVQVSCGASHVLAVTNEREVFSWGRGDNGIVNEPVLIRLNLPYPFGVCLYSMSLIYDSSTQTDYLVYVPVCKVASG